MTNEIDSIIYKKWTHKYSSERAKLKGGIAYLKEDIEAQITRGLKMPHIG